MILLISFPYNLTWMFQFILHLWHVLVDLCKKMQFINLQYNWAFLVICRRVTFICGRAGVCALGAVVAKHCGDDRLCEHYLTEFEKVLHHVTLAF